MAKLLNDSMTIKLHQELCQLQECQVSSDTLNEAEQKYKTYHHWLKTWALARWKDEWLEDCYERIIQTYGRMSHDRSPATDRAQAVFRVMPECGHIADMIQSMKPHTQEQRLSAVQDLLSLCTRDFEVIYCPGEEAVDGACPVCQCKLPEVKRNRADHIHACHRREFKARAAAKKSSRFGSIAVQYCLLCFKWFDDAVIWEEHCRDHLTSMTSKWCAMRIYCHTMISPGYCPLCLGDEGLSAAKRMRQWTRNSVLMEHVEKHMDDVRSWPMTCPCGAQVQDMTSFRYHLSDIHGLWKAEWRSFGRKRTLEEGAGEMRPCQRRKLAKTGDKIIEWSPSPGWQSPSQLTSRQALLQSAKASNKAKVSQKKVSASLTFIEWSLAAKSGSSTPGRSRHEDLCTDDPATLAHLPVGRYLEMDSDNPGTVKLDDEEEVSDDQALLEMPSQSDEQVEDTATEDILDDPLWPSEMMSWMEDSPEAPFDPVTDRCSDAFEDLLDPALFCSEGSTSLSLSSRSSRDSNTPQVEDEDGLDLPSLESLLNDSLPGFPSASHKAVGEGSASKPTLQMQGWVEVPASDGTIILH